MDKAATEDDLDEETADQEITAGGAWKLYCSRALTAWGDRLWAFGLGLLLYKIYPEDLSVVSGYGLANSAVSIIFGASIGNWIDSSQRLTAAKTFLIIQNTSVALNCCILAAYFHWEAEAIQHFGSWVTAVVATLSIVIALVSTLSSAGSKIVVEKDWIVVIAGGDDDKLASMNSIFRTIDLVCLTVSPVLAGVLFSFTSYVITAIVIGGWNICSVVFEYLLLVSIYKQFGGLAKKPTQTAEPKGGVGGIMDKVTGSAQGWTYYFTHKVRNAGLGLAFLYMTVLGFDNITWAFALMQCVSEVVLGILVAVSALVGIAGSLAFPPLRKLLGKERAGMVGMGALVSSLSLCVVSVWLPGSPFDPWLVKQNVTEILEEGSGMVDESENSAELCHDGIIDITSVSVLLTGIILARAGLWMADLSITQILQENVEEQKRGVIGGVQNSLNSSLNLLKFGLVLLMPDQHMFGILIILSFTFICLGATSLTSYACSEGKVSCARAKTEYSQAKTEEPSEVHI
eukprot:TRINITY_DN41749_c0_g1_i1.p1 TRINITY_DN41749_c0_g1~~TRINITY_DN41749_c0_g1_i1.p1  ORF type:complete len:515 (-),score=149.24 TRINITY_DN41749_c0_g1_i1:159-1703(-)